MRALVTGGSGFIGANVVLQLQKAGFKVRVYDTVYPVGLEDVEFHHGEANKDRGHEFHARLPIGTPSSRSASRALL